MSLELTGPFEGVTTQLACVRFVPRVFPHMAPPSGWVGESGLTHLTYIGLGSCKQVMDGSEKWASYNYAKAFFHERHGPVKGAK